jgi:peptidoglycan/LPS O-acetylase OafA/YrhL
MTKTINTPRYAYLDALRGIAALIVVFHHCLLTFSSMETPDAGNMAIALLVYTPLRLFWAGQAAVIVFFVLSGFVLTVMLTRKPPLTYMGFAIKRVARIYLPYVVVVSIGIALVSAFQARGIAGLSTWFNDSWTHPVSQGLLVDHALMLGNVTYNHVDNPIWSLVHEMRYSLAFPLIVWIAKRARPQYVLAGSFVISITALAGLHRLPGNQFLDSLQYLFVFVAGAVLALQREAIPVWYRQRESWVRRLLPALALLLLAANGLPRRHAAVEVLVVNVIGSYLAAPLLLMCLVGARSGRAFLEHPVLLFLGRISYSLYLSHLLVLLSLLYGFEKIAPPEVVIWFVPPVAVAIAALLYRWVEKPAMALGETLRGYAMRERFVRPERIPVAS